MRTPNHAEGKGPSFYEIMHDLGELIDSARDCLNNAGANSVAELMEAMRIAHSRTGGDHHQWATLRPLAREAADFAFDNAVINGEILPASCKAWPRPLAFDLAEIQAARIYPECIVEDYLYSDVALFPAPGATGKTTLMLYEAACIAGGSDNLYSKRILKHGPVVIITAEDAREQMGARLREILLDNGMLAKQAEILKNILVCDVAGLGLKLTEVDRDVVVTSATLNSLIRFLSATKPVIVIIDPAVSFGVGESRVNDSEQGLIEAARTIRNAVGCCVRFVHHTGKKNAQEGAVDQ